MYKCNIFKGGRKEGGPEKEKRVKEEEKDILNLAQKRFLPHFLLLLSPCIGV